MRFCDFVKRKSTFLPPLQKTAMLHESQMLRRHVVSNLASLSEFSNRIRPVKQHLDHA
jgi:hypothetical protein